MSSKRIDKLLKKTKDANADAFLSFDPADIKYFTHGLDAEGAILISEEGTHIFSGPIYYEYLKDNAKSPYLIHQAERITEDAIEFIKTLGIRNVAIDTATTSASRFKTLSEQLNLIDFTDITKKIRMIKEKEEINNIKRAVYAARNALIKVYPLIRVGVTEKEIADELTYQIRKAGAQTTSFETIVASGANAAYPHHKPTNKPLKEGEFVIMDFGAIVDGYCSDATCTVLVGKKSDELANLFNAVFYAQLYATEMIVTGKTRICDIEKRAREELKKYGLDKYFTHSLGHGVGLEVHEFPYINLKNETTVEKNMVFTIEPGIYIPGKLGIRLEHMVVIGDIEAEVIGFTPFVDIM